MAFDAVKLLPDWFYGVIAAILRVVTMNSKNTVRTIRPQGRRSCYKKLSMMYYWGSL
jgi:hypothetical protein